LIFLINVYTLLNKIRDKGKTVSAWKRGDRGGGGGGGGNRGEMTQTLYAHMNKRKKKLSLKSSSTFGNTSTLKPEKIYHWNPTKTKNPHVFMVL
jgi:hypothetical protein